MPNTRRWLLVACSLFASGCAAYGSGAEGAAYQHGAVPQVIQSSPPSAWVEFKIPGNGHCPTGIATGSDKSLWYTDPCGELIGRVTLDGRFSRFAVPAGTEPDEIAAGRSGVLWFTGAGSNVTGDTVGKITTSGTITLYKTPTANSGPVGITQGPDGAMWFTEWNASRIGRIDGNGRMTEYPLLPSSRNPEGITTGPDGALWFAEASTDNVGRITPDGTVTEVNVGAPTNFIALARDGALWATEDNADGLARITSAGVVTTFHVRGANPFVIISGPHGDPWFTAGGKTLERFNLTSGDMAPHIDPNYNSSPEALTVGPDGNIWFAEFQTGKIGVYVRHQQVATPSEISFTAIGQTQTFSVVERLYKGTFSATGCDPSIATVSPTRGATTFTVTAVGPGTCAIAVRDSEQNESFVTVDVNPR